MKVKTALILCAGRGKRLNPLTLKKPQTSFGVKQYNSPRKHN